MTSEELRELRKAFQLSQSDLANLVGYSTRQIQNMESGKCSVPKWMAFVFYYLQKA